MDAVKSKPKPAVPFSDEGRKLIALLQRAAGVQDMRVKAITCRVAIRESITFTVELLANEDDVKSAVGESEITRLGDAVVEMANA